MTTDIKVGSYYKWDHQNIVVKVLSIIGDAENGGMVMVDQMGEHTPIGMQFFLARYTEITVPELVNNAQENKGRQ